MCFVWVWCVLDCVIVITMLRHKNVWQTEWEQQKEDGGLQILYKLDTTQDTEVCWWQTSSHAGQQVLELTFNAVFFFHIFLFWFQDFTRLRACCCSIIIINTFVSSGWLQLSPSRLPTSLDWSRRYRSDTGSFTSRHLTLRHCSHGLMLAFLHSSLNLSHMIPLHFSHPILALRFSCQIVIFYPFLCSHSFFPTIVLVLNSLWSVTFP